VIRLRSLADIAELTIRFEGQEVSVGGSVEKGGSVRFKLALK
jgi:hypothetical protein